MTADAVRIVELGDHADAETLDMLVELAFEDQRHYAAHPQESRAELAARLRPGRLFTGENHILVARDGADAALGLCWVVLFDPGTGLEAELAELYVRPGVRGRGVATSLARAAMDLLRGREVTFASVWTRSDNAAALAAYRAVGFRETEQTVLTWLPLS
jgi:ribosomal protein S18 acetylase RimI-like enzyme